VAAYRLARLDQARALALVFLRTARKISRLRPARIHARQIADSCRTLTRRTRAAGTEPGRPSAASDTNSVSARERGHEAVRGDRNPQLPLMFEPASAVFTGQSHVADPLAAGSRARRLNAASAAEVHEPNRLDASPSPDVQLPAFPAVSLPEVTIQFEVDDQCFPSDSGSRVGSAVDVLLRRDYAALRLQKGFDELISVGAVRGLEHFWYQLETVRRLLRDFRGRVLLADEVGLGKTIEAGLALKEYWMRGLVSKALILTPPSLVGQWVEELTSKFGLAAVPAEAGKRPDDEIWARQPIVVASLPLVRQRGYRERLTGIEYDLVIVDEAHTLKNRASAAWRLVNELQKRFLFLLSATPVGNDLSELYNLILLLKPGLLKTEAQFRLQFGTLAALQQPERRSQLRTLLREVMIRNTRAHIDVRLLRRLAATEVVSPTEAEAEVHEQLSSYIRAGYRCGQDGPMADDDAAVAGRQQPGSPAGSHRLVRVR
jgi:SNF2 family DNA or RNA helicase